MTNTDPSHDAYHEILHEHTKMRTMLDELRLLLFEQTVVFSEIAQRLTDLRQLLVSHFQTEEDSGCFGDVVNHAPRVSGKVETLIAEHADLSQELQELEALAAGGQGVQADWEEIGTRFGEFTARLMQHEAIENELLQEVFTEDIGSKD